MDCGLVLDDLAGYAFTRLETSARPELARAASIWQPRSADAVARFAPLAAAAGTTLRAEVVVRRRHSCRPGGSSRCSSTSRATPCEPLPTMARRSCCSRATRANGRSSASRTTGRGFPPDELGRVFERFFRGRATRDQQRGSGLGLTVVRRIVEAAGGSVSALAVRAARSLRSSSGCHAPESSSRAMRTAVVQVGQHGLPRTVCRRSGRLARARRRAARPARVPASAHAGSAGERGRRLPERADARRRAAWAWRRPGSRTRRSTRPSPTASPRRSGRPRKGLRHDVARRHRRIAADAARERERGAANAR